MATKPEARRHSWEIFEAPGGRHDNDGKSTTQMAIVLTASESRSERPGFLLSPCTGEHFLYACSTHISDRIRDDILGEVKYMIKGLLDVFKGNGRI